MLKIHDQSQMLLIFSSNVIFVPGNGTCEAVKNKEDVGSKVISTLQCALQGFLVDAKVSLGDWETSNIAPGALILWPAKIPNLFYGRRYTFYAMKVCNQNKI